MPPGDSEAGEEEGGGAIMLMGKPNIHSKSHEVFFVGWGKLRINHESPSLPTLGPTDATHHTHDRNRDARVLRRRTSKGSTIS